VSANAPTPPTTPPISTEVRHSVILSGLAGEIWERIRLEILEAIQAEIDNLLKLRIGGLANVACTAGAPGTPLAASADAAWAEVDVPFRSRAVRIETHAYPSTGWATVAVWVSRPGSGAGTVLAVAATGVSTVIDGIIEAGSRVSFYVPNVSGGIEVVTANVILRELT
jgi:hypothetical protein